MMAHNGVVTKAQAEAAERMKEMVLQDNKLADSCAPCSSPQASLVSFDANFTHTALFVVTVLIAPAQLRTINSGCHSMRFFKFSRAACRFVDGVENDAIAATGPLKGAFSSN
jgi:hypothetical protein